MPSTYFGLVLREFGGTTEADAALCERTNVTPDVPPGEITLGQQLEQVRNLNRLQPRGWGLRVGSRFEAVTHGPLGFATVSAPTLGDSIEVIARFGHVRSPYFRLESRRDSSWLTLRVDECIAFADVERIPLVEVLMLSLQQLVESVLGRSMREASFRFAWAAPAYAGEYRAQFHGTVVFDVPHTEMAIPIRWLPLRCPMADPFVYEASVRRLETLARRLEDEDFVAARIEELLDASRNLGLSLEEIASHMNVSARTLIRHIRKAGTTYHALLDAHRQERTRSLLANPSLHIAEVSDRVGYADPANFSRACRRWFGVAPGRYRRRLLATH